MKRHRGFGVQYFSSLKSGVSRLQLVLFLLIASAAICQTVTATYDFGSHTDDPLSPQFVGAIAQGRDGNLWSTTPAGGKNGIGAAFRITPAGKLADIHDFNPAALPVPEGTPYSGFTLGTDGTFYGTMSDGGASGNGAVFRMTAAGTVRILYSFTGGNDGADPQAPPIEGTDGNFYGTTEKGGTDLYGTVYKITPTGKLTTLHQFNPSNGDGAYPIGALVQGSDGNFYGTTYQGSLEANCGSDNVCGTVFQITPTGTYKQLYIFPFDPLGTANITSGLVQGSNGSFYGTAESGGANHLGEVFEISSTGTFKDLYNFTGGTDGANPSAGLVLATDGNFYGLTLNNGTDGFGTVYEISPSGAFTLVGPLDGTNGGNSSVTLMLHTSGTLYGDAKIGGQTTNLGTFFQVANKHFAPFVDLLPTSGEVAATIEIRGRGFTGTAAVSFNGIPASKFTIVSSTYMSAVVPTGATTGFVTVTTPGGALQSNKKFHVTPQITSFTPTSGPVGTPVTITGVSLTQTTEVTFGNVTATTFKINSDKEVTATVPTGAVTGKVAISTSGGRATSATNFTVTQ